MARTNHFLVLVGACCEYHVFYTFTFGLHRRETRRHLSAGADLTICCVGDDGRSFEMPYARFIKRIVMARTNHFLVMVDACCDFPVFYTYTGGVHTAETRAGT